MTPTQRKAIESAIKTLEFAAYASNRSGLMDRCEKSADALRAALAEPAEYVVECNGTKSAVLTAMMNSRTKREAALAEADERSCTCHPDDNPPQPCPKKFALGECRQAAASNGRSDET